MLKLNRPPQYAIDESADNSVEWILPSDPAWDKDRAEQERQALAEQARGNGADEDEAMARHPLAVWYRCETRYSQTAPLTLPERLRKSQSDGVAGTVTVDDYLTGKPTIWRLKPLGVRAWRRVMAADQVDWPVEAVKHGLVRIEQPGEDPIDPARDSTGAITEGWLDWLHTEDRSLIPQLGAAIFALSQRGNGDEGKR